MTDTLLSLLKVLGMFLPFLLFIWLSGKANLKKPLRSRQFLMPILALFYCIVLVVLLNKISEYVMAFIDGLPTIFYALADQLDTMADGALAQFAETVNGLGEKFEDFLKDLNVNYILFVVLNPLFMLVHVILKRILVTLMKAIFKTGNRFYEFFARLFYDHDADKDQWYIKAHMGQARTYMKTFYIAGIVISMAAVLLTSELFKEELLAVPFYPVFGLIILGELYFFLAGLTRREMYSQTEGEEEESANVTNYVVLRQALRKLFGDKLTSEDTTVNNGFLSAQTNDEILSAMERSTDTKCEAYGRFMRGKLDDGLELDRNFLMSGLDLLNGKSILFNDPFHYDLIPYAFYAMNRTLLRHKKVLIILGRHGAEEDIEAWCREGLCAINNIPDLWKIGLLTQEEQELDVGIVTRSSVHDLGLHEKNEDFFQQVEFAVLIEPSRLITTAQVGLNSLIRHCRRSGKSITYCSTDKNCDGLVDALSHILMCSISEVSATNRHNGTCSYMCWETDGEYLQHRMLPNLSRYLGMGTELSFAALKNQVSGTEWYGGDAFPVVDMHWIVKQYYYDLLNYASLPTEQEVIDERFRVSANMWSARAARTNYITVEDEACNMFEVKRSFSTRASEQSFINVISPEYLLKDYMAENDGIFNADPKAIPYIVADYARTERNVALRLCLRMSAGFVSAEDLRRELMLINADTGDLVGSLWHAVCACAQPVGRVESCPELGELLKRTLNGKEYIFDRSVIRMKRKYSMASGKMEDQYFISDPHFQAALLTDLHNASYIAEEEDGKQNYLGSELQGHIFQRYLPGQFFTFNGKYYEMLSVTSDGQVLVRRAADHINGRPSYRQVRHYSLSNAVDSTAMGACRDIGGLRVTRQFADIRVDTSAYWELERYNDFAAGRKVSINGIPTREYYNKPILRIDFTGASEKFTPQIRRTLAVLFNEVFRTLFAENHEYISAVVSGEAGVPLTYGLNGAGGFTPDENAIYIIEDSQLDIGLLVAVERNLNRIFSIVCDYLEWHFEALDRSLNPPPQPEPPDYTVSEPQEEEPKTLWGRIKKFLKKIAGAVKRFFQKIGSFFKKLFGRKKKEEEPADDMAAVPENVEAPVNEPPVTEEVPAAVEQIPEEPAAEAETDEAAEEDIPGASANTDELSADEPLAADEEAETANEPAAGETTVDEVEPADGEVPDGNENEEFKPLMSISFRAERDPSVEQPVPEEEVPVQEETAEEQDPESKDEPEAAAIEPTEDSPAEEDTEPAEAPVSGPEAELEFEPEQLVQHDKPMKRRPYHQRYYLLYGGGSVPAEMDLGGTLDALKSFGFGNSGLKQARNGKDVAELIEKNYDPTKQGAHYCDFCGVELAGTEYDVLSDGRERCMNCGRTAVKTAAEFVEIYNDITSKMEAFYGARITVPVKVQMVNAKRLHKRLGKTFVPTGKPDGRVLGVAIKDKNGYSILVENGSPKLASTMTIAHELTHIWQYLNWDGKAIRSKYGAAQELEVYEGMAKWSEIQYAYLIGEAATAKREEIITRMRQDEYGRGFVKYLSRYPLSEGTHLSGATPFEDIQKPL